MTADRQREQTLLDRRVYAVAADLEAVTGTAADILNKIPSVDVDADGKVTLRGDPNVTILVDGKPSAQFSGGARGASLQAFPAQDIDRIEVMTHPPAQYKAEGTAGVINIVTRRNRRRGLSGSANLSLGDKRRFVAGLNVDDTIGKLKLSGSVTLRQDERERKDGDRAAIDPVSGATMKSVEAVDQRFTRLAPSVKLAADYAVDDRRSLSLSFDRRERTDKPAILQQDQGGPTTAAPETVTTRQGYGREYDVFEDEGVQYDQKFGRPGEVLSLAFQRSIYDARDNYAYINDYIAPTAPPSQDTLRLRQNWVVLTASADFTLPLGRGRSLKIGYALDDDTAYLVQQGGAVDPLGGQARDNPAITNQFRFHQQNNAAYIQYEAPVGKWAVQTGLRFEQNAVHDLLIAGDVATHQSIFRAFPSLNLDRVVGKDGKLSFNLSRRVTWPDADDLNPLVDSADIFNLRAGNPALLPQDTWSYEIGEAGKFEGVDYALTAYYRFDRDIVTMVTRPVSADVTLTTSENLPKSRSWGLEFSGGGRLGPRLTYALSCNLFYNQIDARALEQVGARDAIGLNAKASLDWRPTSADTAQISFSRTDRRLTPQGYIGATDPVNLGLRHQLWGGLSAVATVTDLFDSQRYQRIVTTPTFQDTYTRHWLGRVGYVGLSYAFGATRKAKPAGFEYDTANPK